jgi:tellurite methyltransferase
VDNAFWETEYNNLDRETFGKPSEEIYGIANKLEKGSQILDVGAGEGRNAIYLSKLGFDVDAFDISKKGIKKMDYLAAKNGIYINSFICDISNFKFTKQYDLIVAHGILQFIDKTIRDEFIEQMKDFTKPGGYNIISVFTDATETPEDLRNLMVGVFKDGQIQSFYTEWDVDYKSYTFNDEHENGIKHTHSANKIIARKMN